MTTSPPPTAGRRNVLKTAAWTVPAIAVAAPAPAFAASPCQAVPYQAGWTATSPASGTLTTGNGTNGYTSTYYTGQTESLYLSVADNASNGTPSPTANNATVTLTRSLTLVVGRPYTLVFTVASQHAGNNAPTSQLQKLDISVGGVTIGKFTTEADATLASGYTALSTPATGVGSQTITLGFTPTTAVNQLQYLWTIPAKGTGNSGNGDIAISAPTISGC